MVRHRGLLKLRPVVGCVSHDGSRVQTRSCRVGDGSRSAPTGSLHNAPWPVGRHCLPPQVSGQGRGPARDIAECAAIWRHRRRGSRRRWRRQRDTVPVQPVSTPWVAVRVGVAAALPLCRCREGAPNRPGLPCRWDIAGRADWRHAADAPCSRASRARRAAQARDYHARPPRRVGLQASAGADRAVGGAHSRGNGPTLVGARRIAHACRGLLLCRIGRLPDRSLVRCPPRRRPCQRDLLRSAGLPSARVSHGSAQVGRDARRDRRCGGANLFRSRAALP